MGHRDDDFLNDERADAALRRVLARLGEPVQVAPPPDLVTGTARLLPSEPPALAADPGCHAGRCRGADQPGPLSLGGPGACRARALQPAPCGGRGSRDRPGTRGRVPLPPAAWPNGTTADGCETNTKTSVGNCGSCGNACSVSHGAPACVNGTCAVASCDPGFADCNGSAADGCEVNTQTSASNCGACGNDCRNFGQTCCGTYCADLENDFDNCGSCGFRCPDPDPFEIGECIGGA